MPYDGGDLYIKVDLYINGSWVEVTSRARGGRAAGGVDIEHGRSTGAIQAETSQLNIVIGNADGYLTEGNPESPWYPYVGRGCRIRVSVSGVLASDVVRFDGEIDTMVAVYPGGSDSSMRIIATGILGGRLGLGSDPLRSAMNRSMSGVSADDYQPLAYWPLEDGTDGTLLGAQTSGTAAAVASGSVALSSYSGAAGSGALPVLSQSGTISGTFPTTTLAASSSGDKIFQVQFVAMMPSTMSANATFLDINVPSTSSAGVVLLRIEWVNSSTSLVLRWYDNTFAVVGTATIPFATYPQLYDVPALYGISVYSDLAGSPGSIFAFLTVYNDGSAIPVAFDFGTWTGSIVPAPLRWRAYAFAGNTGWAFGHMILYTDPAVLTGANIQDNARALDGYTGETASDRIERLCREEGITASITGTSAQAMGPQSVATLADLLIECEAVDGGLLSDGADGGGLTYRCLSSIYNQSASLAVTRGSLDVDVAPVWDNRNIRNDVTASRSGGSSSRQTDEAHVTRTRRRIKDSATVNVATDSQLSDQAMWRVNVGTTPAPRYNGVGINLRERYGMLLADTVLALEAGGRFTAAEATLPSQHPPGGIDALVIGWTEHLDAVEWTFAPNCVDYAPYRVAILDDDDYGKFDTDGSDLTAAVSSSATSLSVATTTGTSPLWTTDAGEMPIPLIVAGEVMSATAIAAPTTITYGAVGTAAHGSNASVVPSLPASVASGNLLILIAAIRNSGTGTVNTPTGYTRLSVFATTDNVQVFAKVAGSSESAPTVSFSGGVANATTSAQIIRIAGAFSDPAECFVRGQALLNSSAQDISYPGLPLEEPVSPTAIHNAIVIYVGWKQDDWTSVASPGTEIAEASTTTGDDQGLVWAYQIQTTATDVLEGSFVVTGGAAAISRGAVFAIRSNVQTFTATRSVNGIVKAQAAGAAVNVYRPWRFAL